MLMTATKYSALPPYRYKYNANIPEIKKQSIFKKSIILDFCLKKINRIFYKLLVFSLLYRFVL